MLRDALDTSGFAHLAGPFLSPEEAFDAVREAIGPMEVIGDFVLPPLEGPPSRDFQTLHVDFGVPLVLGAPTDVARYTALHVPVARQAVADTRLVRLSAVLGQRAWPDHPELLRRFAAYGDSHGQRAELDGYVEGSFARMVEAAAGVTPRLPSLKEDPTFLCGNEFCSLAQEDAFLEDLGVAVDRVEVSVALQSGELLVFDNLAMTHGRRGVRQPGELHQRVFGHRALDRAGQSELRDRFMSAFGG